MLSPELETLDQLCGGDMGLAIIRRLFIDDERFYRASLLMLDEGVIRLIGPNGDDVISWQWREVLSSRRVLSTLEDYRLSITERGARRMCG
jgi:hypothetical protein